MDSGQLVDYRGIRIINLATILSSVVFGARSLTFSIYLNGLNSVYPYINPTLIGMLFTISALVGALFAIPIGALADRMGRKKFIVIGRILQTTGVLLLVFFTEPLLLLVAMMFQDVGMATSQSPLNAMIADKSPSEKRNATFSRNYMALSVGSAMGTVVGVVPDYLNDNFGLGLVRSYTPLFIMILLTSFLSFIAVTFLREPERPKRVKEDSRKGTKVVRLTSTGTILKYALTLSIIQLGAGMIIQLFSLWLNLAFGAKVIQLVPLYFVVNLSMGLGYYLANWLASAVGSVPSIVVSQALAIVLLVAIPNIEAFELVGLIYIVRTMLMNMSNPIMTSFITGIVPPNERASALSISNSTGAVARAVGPGIGGYLMDQVSMAMPFYVCGALYTFSTAMFYAFFRKTKPR